MKPGREQQRTSESPEIVDDDVVDDFDDAVADRFRPRAKVVAVRVGCRQALVKVHSAFSFEGTHLGCFDQLGKRYLKELSAGDRNGWFVDTPSRFAWFPAFGGDLRRSLPSVAVAARR